MNRPTKIYFSIPTAGEVEPITALAAADIARDPRVVYTQFIGRPSDHVRNAIVRAALQEEGTTHILMMDSDMKPPPHALECLLELDVNMATGIYPLRYVTQNAVYITSNLQSNGGFLSSFSNETGPFKVDAAGSGLILIKREVFEELEWPWFNRVEGFTQDDTLGGDIYFSKRAKLSGYQYTADPRVICGHIKQLDLLALSQALKGI